MILTVDLHFFFKLKYETKNKKFVELLEMKIDIYIQNNKINPFNFRNFLFCYLEYQDNTI